jgi:hypothetical protein
MFPRSNAKYYRFDADTGTHNISLEQWMKEDELTSLTEQYVNSPLRIYYDWAFGSYEGNWTYLMLYCA